MTLNFANILSTRELSDIVFSFLSLRDILNFRSSSRVCLNRIEQYWPLFAKYCFYDSFGGFDLQFNFDSGFNFISTLFNFYRNKRIENLVVEVLETSSVDREEECGGNILVPSFCFELLTNSRSSFPNETTEHMGLLCQTVCRCVADRPCYWSSQPSSTSNISESITLRLASQVSIIFGFSVTPYQAFFHPSSPIYSPIEVCLDVLMPTLTVNDKNVKSIRYVSMFQSPFFPVANQFREQFFRLNKPLLCLGGIVRVVMRGMIQRQTLSLQNMDGSGRFSGASSLSSSTSDSYYTCLSFLSILGVTIPQYQYSFQRICRQDNGSAMREIISSSWEHPEWQNVQSMLPSSSIYVLPLPQYGEQELCEKAYYLVHLSRNLFQSAFQIIDENSDVMDVSNETSLASSSNSSSSSSSPVSFSRSLNESSVRDPLRFVPNPVELASQNQFNAMVPLLDDLCNRLL